MERKLNGATQKLIPRILIASSLQTLNALARREAHVGRLSPLYQSCCILKASSFRLRKLDAVENGAISSASKLSLLEGLSTFNARKAL